MGGGGRDRGSLISNNNVCRGKEMIRKVYKDRGDIIESDLRLVGECK